MADGIFKWKLCWRILLNVTIIRKQIIFQTAAGKYYVTKTILDILKQPSPKPMEADVILNNQSKLWLFDINFVTFLIV